MRVFSIDGKDYRLPNSLNIFQQDMYVHLINWKWKHITREPGKDGDIEYDAILPDGYANKFPMLYSGAIEAVRQHLKRFPFRIHTYFNHMASSQAANINLFLPVLRHPNVNDIMGKLNPDFAKLATAELDNGYRIEFWDEPFRNLGDKTKVSGTDSDIGVAYYNHKNEPCLWLIEHKLTEKEFTECGGYKSKGRQGKHDCTKNFEYILENKDTCYYHDVRKFSYWNITDANQTFFVNHSKHESCPFKGGMNQLWRNQLLALSIEQDDRQPYKYVHFSVVKHPRNEHLSKTLTEYAYLVAGNPKFSVFDSTDILEAANKVGNADLDSWIDWYKGLYNL